MGVMRVYGALLQLPGMDQPQLTMSEQISTNWIGMGFMRYPLLVCLVIGIIVIIWKFFSNRIEYGLHG